MSSRVLKTIDPNIARGPETPGKSSLRKEFQSSKSAKKYRAADLLDIALKHERSGDKHGALSAYEDAAENISNNAKILQKIEILKSRIAEDFEQLAQEKQEEDLRRTEDAPDDEHSYDMEGDVSMMTDDQESLDGSDDGITESGTLYSEYDPAKRAEILQQLQSKTLSALEYQLLDRLNKGDKDELLQLKQIGEVRACGILELREKHEDQKGSTQGEDSYFHSLEQLEDIYMKPKQIKSFLKQNATFLLGL